MFEECDEFIIENRNLKQKIQKLEKSGSELLAEKNAYEIGMQQWKDEAQRKTAECKELRLKLQIAFLALEDISQYNIDDCPYCEEKIIRAISALTRMKE